MWNWEDKNWPNFEYSLESEEIFWKKFEKKFHIFIGACLHIDEDKKEELFIDILSYEALETSRIEGEFFSQENLQSSLRKNFGLKVSPNKSTDMEKGIAKAFEYNYKNFSKKLSHKILYTWNSLLRFGKENIVEGYRKEAVYIVSYTQSGQKIHFEGVKAENLSREMGNFLQWLEDSKEKISPLIRASIAHLYFASIHPFEDGNGRISRMLSEKCISESIGQPALLSISLAIQEKKSEYYKNLELVNKTLEISSWIEYFSRIILRAQEISLEIFQFTLNKKRFYEKFSAQLNIRQKKCIARIFQAGIYGFTGGMSVQKYISITHTSPATATRDLKNLVEKNIFSVTGKSRAVRYWLEV